MALLQANDVILGIKDRDDDHNELKRNESAAGYEPFKMPADLIQAKKHGQAKRVYVSKKEDKYEEEGRELCVCCGLPVEGELIPINAGLEKLYHLGSGFALYFRFIKFSVALLVLIFLSSGLYNLISNVVQGDCVDDAGALGNAVTSECVKGYILSFAIPNKKNNSKALDIQLGLNLLSVILIMIFFHYIRYRFRKTEVEADDKTITPSDYTIAIYGLPIETTTAQIKEWIHGFSTEAMPLKIERVVRAYSINNYIQLSNHQARLLKQKEIIIKKDIPNKSDQEELDTLNKMIQQLSTQIAALKNGGLKHAPIAYVTFEKAESSTFMQQKFRQPLLQKMLGTFVSTFITTTNTFHGKQIDVFRAPEPTDIMWENLGYTYQEGAVKRLYTNIITFVLIAQFWYHHSSQLGTGQSCQSIR